MPQIDSTKLPNGKRVLSKDSSDADIVESVLSFLRENTGNVLSNPENDLRVETWTKRNKNGKERRYWQWAERGTVNQGKQGGQKWRSYGGPLETIPQDQLSTRQRKAGHQGRAVNSGKRPVARESILATR